MQHCFTREIKSDLLALDQLFKKSLSPWWDDLYVYVDKLRDDFTFNILPATVICSYRHLGLNKSISVAMANLFKIVYLGNRVHLLVKDEEEGQTHGQELQFTVLIGDYILGKILQLLLEAGVDGFLDDFAAMICEINEGLIIQYKTEGELLQVLKMTRASLYSTAFFTGARLAGLERNWVEGFKEIGHNLGMGLEILYGLGQAQESASYLLIVKSLLQNFDKHFRPRDAFLEKILSEALANVTVASSIAVG